MVRKIEEKQHNKTRCTLENMDFRCTLAETYQNVALRMKMTVTDDTMYNCTKINVAENIQDAWIAYYRDEYRKRAPYVSETDIMAEIMKLLLLCGAKVDRSLRDNEVTVEHGFIVNAA